MKTILILIVIFGNNYLFSQTKELFSSGFLMQHDYPEEDGYRGRGWKLSGNNRKCILAPNSSEKVNFSVDEGARISDICGNETGTQVVVLIEKIERNEENSAVVYHSPIKLGRFVDNTYKFIKLDQNILGGVLASTLGSVSKSGKYLLCEISGRKNNKNKFPARSSWAVVDLSGSSLEVAAWNLDSWKEFQPR